MNLIVCGSEPNASNDDNDNNNNNNTIIINNNPNNNNHHTHSNVLQYQSSDQSKINYLMKHKQEAMNHSDGGGGEIDDLSDDPSSPESDNFDDSDLLSSTAQDEVTAQLAAAGLCSSFLLPIINGLILFLILQVQLVLQQLLP